MPNPFNNLSDFFKHAQNAIADSLNKEVAEVIRDEEQKQIERIVYESYDPFAYTRRHDQSGGLQDRQSMVAVVEKHGDSVVLSVINMAHGQQQEDMYIAPLVEYGDSSGHGEYDYKYNRDGTSWKYLRSRPFTEQTIIALKASGKHVQAMKIGLIRNGFRVEG